jgi:DNA polymerase-3 subunit beta
MRIAASAYALVDAASLAASIAGDSDARIPAYAAVRLTAGGGELTIGAVTRDAALSASIEAEGEGETAVPAKQLAGLLKHFGDAAITISATENSATIASGRSHFRLPVTPVANLPASFAIDAESGRIEIDAKILRALFRRTLYAASTEKTRFYLNGIFLHDIENGLAGVATDGIALARTIIIPVTTSLSRDRTLIIPLPAAKTILKLLHDACGTAMLRRSERLLELAVLNTRFVTKLVDSNYPQYERLIAGKAKGTATVDRADLAETLARFAAVNDPNAPGVALNWSNKELRLSARDGSEDFLEAEVRGAGNAVVQTARLAEALDELRGDHVTLAAHADGSPLRVSDPDDGSFLALIALLRGWPSSTPSREGKVKCLFRPIQRRLRLSPRPPLLRPVRGRRSSSRALPLCAVA